MSYEAFAPEMVFGEYELIGSRVGYNDIVLDIETAGLLRDVVAQEFLPKVNSKVVWLDEFIDRTIGGLSRVTESADEQVHLYVGSIVTFRPEDTWSLNVLTTSYGLEDTMDKHMEQYRVAASAGMVMEAVKQTRVVRDMAAICIEDVLNNKVDLLRREALEEPLTTEGCWDVIERLDTMRQLAQEDSARRLRRYLP